jgi:hypothetical protein
MLQATPLYPATRHCPHLATRLDSRATALLPTDSPPAALCYFLTSFSFDDLMFMLIVSLFAEYPYRLVLLFFLKDLKVPLRFRQHYSFKI